MSLHCTYNTNHWPCNYCTASDPKDKNAECNFQDSKEGRMIVNFGGRLPGRKTFETMYKKWEKDEETDMSCTIVIDYGGNIPEAFSQKMRVANKEHTCCECNGKIHKGEEYCYASGIWEDIPDSFKTCKDCYQIREAFFCNFVFGSMWEDFRNACAESEFLSEKALSKLTHDQREKCIQIFDEVTSEEN